MNGAQFCISWDSYLKQVSQGFSLLQQNAEFVDMTLAADGHLVKVHQNIVALASPYLKALIQSVPCPHPVIFLNEISHEILSYILAYIYMGEVKIPINLIGKFIDACKALSIKGIDNIAASAVSLPAKKPDPPVERISIPHPPANNLAAQITINTQDDNCNVELGSDDDVTFNVNDEEMPLAPTTTVSNNVKDFDTKINNTEDLDSDVKSDKSVDTNSISKFIIMKPKNSRSTKVTNDTNVTEKSIKILSDNIFNLKDWEQLNTTNMQLNNPIECPVNTNFNTNETEKAVELILNKNQYSNTCQDNTKELDSDVKSDKSVDMNSISKFIIMKPKNNSPTKVTIDKNGTEKSNKILSSNTFNLKDWEQLNTTNMELNNSIECPVNTNFNTNETEKAVEVILNTNQYSNTCPDDTEELDSDVKSDKSVDINSISKFIIMKPKNSRSTKVTIDKNGTEKSIKILSDNTFNLKDWEQLNTTNMQLNNSIECPVNINFNTNETEKAVEVILNTNQYTKTCQNNTVALNTNIEIPINTNIETWQPNVISGNDIEVSANLISNPVNIVLKTDDCQPEPVQDTSQVNSNNNVAEEIFDISKLNKKDIQKRIKMIRTHMKLENKTKNTNKITLSEKLISQMDQVPHYTISTRGSLQLLLERFLYNMHHHSSGGRKRRWRCIDYRKSQCQSFIDTDHDIITNVSAEHEHPNHDQQIRNKIRSNLIFTSLSHAMGTINALIDPEDENSDTDTSQQVKKSRKK